MRKFVIKNSPVLSSLLLLATIAVLGLCLSMVLGEKRGLEDKLEKYVEDNETLTNNSSALQDEVWSLNDTLKDLTSSFEETQTQITELDAKIEVLGGEKEKLQTQLEEQKQANDTLGKKVKQLELEKTDLQKQVTAKIQRKKEEQTRLAKVKSEESKTVAVAAINTPSRSTSSPAGVTKYMSATAYTAYCAGCSGVTRTGIDLRANPGLKVIAVDPNVIPLGSKVHVEGYGNAIAGDTGGAIKGNKIDLFMPDKGTALSWGRRQVKVTILK